MSKSNRSTRRRRPRETKGELQRLLRLVDADLKRAEINIKRMQQLSRSEGYDSQLAIIDMQNMLQKQQQVMQMMSQISKMLHDTAMAVIRKMGG